MKIIFLLALLSVPSIHVQAQAPQDIAYYLSNDQISSSAKDYYHGRYQASDDTRTFSILDSLNTRNNSTRPFYIHLVSKMIHQSDGALSESHPNEAIEFLYANTSLVKPEFKKEWAGILAREFMIACERNEQQYIKTFFDKAIVRSKEKNRKNLQDLFKKITPLIRS